MNPTFLPWLGLFTAFLEIILGIWTFRLYLRSPPSSLRTRSILLVAGLLQFLLAGYQLAEVAVCSLPAPTGTRGLLLSRLAFLDITWLPPLSLLLISRILPKPPRWLIVFARISLILGTVFSFWILVDTRFVLGTICSLMYAKYRHIEPYFHLYGGFYEICQMSMIFIPAALIANIEDRNVRLNLADILLGALLFILPALFLAAVKHEIFEGTLPSLMCHFAIFFSFFLARLVRRIAL